MRTCQGSLVKTNLHDKEQVTVKFNLLLYYQG
jgi:hypothetical protein